jgi:transposase
MSTDAAENPPEEESRQARLFEMPSEAVGPPPEPVGRPRMQHADRGQVVMRAASLDALVPEDHQARLVWEYVCGLDMTPLYQRIRAVAGRAGRDPIDPRILLALWLYATLDGVGSAREVDRLCDVHHAYQWICGGVSVNYHTLADFRVEHGQFLDGLLTGSVASLLHQGLVKLERVAQDGVRVRASAGAASFRRRPTLEECQKEAAEQVEALRKELESDPSAGSKRQRAARQRAARERSERIRRALAEMPKAESAKKPEDKAKARVSTTDPEARVMKMADGGFRPAVNVQFASDTGGQIITGVDVSNSGSDQGQLPPMLQQHQARYEKVPDASLVDGGFANKEDIERVSGSEFGTVVYAPVPEPKKNKDRDRYEPLPGESAAVAEWRRRMNTAEAKEIYKDRASTAECVNAIARNRGLRQMPVRGLGKIRCVVLLFALAHNLVRAARLRTVAAVRAEVAVASG